MIKQLFSFGHLIIKCVLIYRKLLKEQKRLDKLNPTLTTQHTMAIVKEINSNEKKWSGFVAGNLPNKHGIKNNGINLNFQKKIGNSTVTMIFDIINRNLGVNFEINI